MNVVNSPASDYLNRVQSMTRANTLNQVAQARQSEQPLDVEQLQSSNQELRDTARETAVDLYSQSLARQAVETYTNASVNNTNSNSSSSSNSESENDVYTFDPAAVNDARQTAQQRAFSVAYLESQSENQNGNQVGRPEFGHPSVQPVSVYV